MEPGRKRARSPAPDSQQQAVSPVAGKLSNLSTRNAALNELLRISSVNYLLDGDETLNALTSIVHECLDWQPQKYRNGTPIFRPDQAWINPPTKGSKAWADHCSDRLSNKGKIMEAEKLRCIESVLVVLRNLSFAAANARLLAFSPNAVAVLVGCLYEGFFFSVSQGAEDSAFTAPGDIALNALQTLLNLAPHLDVSGQKIFCDKLFFMHKGEDGPIMPDPPSFGQAADGSWGFGSLWLAKRLDTKDDVMLGLPKSVLLELTNTAEYLDVLWSIFPALSSIICDPKTPRLVLMTAVDLLQEFVNHARVGVVGEVEQEEEDDIPTARAVLVNMPDSMLDRLVDLLFIPRLGPDSLAYEDPTINIVTRVTTLRLLMGYEATVDTDIRDRTLEVLVPLLEIDSPRMAVRLGLNKRGLVRTRLYDSLVPILSGQTGRTESSLLASQLLKELAKARDENKPGLTYIQGRLVDLSSRDVRASQLVFSHLYPAVASNGDNDAQEDQEESS